jgi:hypothetical protein
MGAAASVADEPSKTDSISNVQIPLKSLTANLRVFQNFETSEVIVLIGDDISSCPEISQCESEEWFEVTISRFQEKYFGSLNGVLSCNVFPGRLNGYDDKSARPMTFDTELNADEKTQAREQYSYQQGFKAVKDSPHTGNHSAGWSSNRISRESNDDKASDSKGSAFCPFCNTSIANDDNHISVCATSKAIKDRFDESDYTIQMVPIINTSYFTYLT